MARLNLSSIETEENLTLDELIPVYAENKADLDRVDKICKAQNAEIKKCLEEMGEDEYTAGGYVAKRIVTEKFTLNEDRLLEVVKKHSIPDVIRTKEFVDSDALEKYLYNTEISAELTADLDSCQEVKEVVQLRLSKAKKKKEEE